MRFYRGQTGPKQIWCSTRQSIAQSYVLAVGLAHDIYSIYEQDDDPFYNRFMTSCFIITTILPRQWKKTLPTKLGSSIILLDWKWDSKNGGPGSPLFSHRRVFYNIDLFPRSPSDQIWCWWYLKHHTGASDNFIAQVIDPRRDTSIIDLIYSRIHDRQQSSRSQYSVVLPVLIPDFLRGVVSLTFTLNIYSTKSPAVKSSGLIRKIVTSFTIFSLDRLQT